MKGMRNSGKRLNRLEARVGRLAANKELKFAVTNILLNVDDAGTVVNLNDVEQGTTDTTRVGDRIHCQSVMFKLLSVIPGTATGRFSNRFLIIHDKQNTITAVSEIFLGTETPQSPMLQFVKDQRLRFNVLYDSGANHMDQYNKGIQYSRRRNLAIKTQFVAASDQIATGAIKLVVISGTGTASTQKPLLIGTVRVNYTDA